MALTFASALFLATTPSLVGMSDATGAADVALADGTTALGTAVPCSKLGESPAFELD